MCRMASGATIDDTIDCILPIYRYFINTSLAKMANAESPSKNITINSKADVADISEEHRRIWVGNLDSRITEFQLLKLMQKCGAIEKFDMLFHKGGPMVGQSRGYAFITFKQNEGATNALIKLDGSNIGGRSIAVRLAKNIKYDDLQRPKPRLEIPALGRGKREDKISKSETIRAIEAKLRTLERQTDDNLELNTTPEENVPFIHRYQFNKSHDDSQRTRLHGKYNNSKPSAPYLRQLKRR